MRLTVLGSGGSLPIPVPTCSCRICGEARREGTPYARNGNSLYLHDLGAMVDAPEFAYKNLNRERVERLEYCFLTHWHPVHVNGLRVLKARDYARRPSEVDFLEYYESEAPTLVTTRPVYERTLDLFGQLDYVVETQNAADCHFLDEDGPLQIGAYEVRHVPYSLSTDGGHDATGFVVEGEGTTLAIVSDDARYLDESRLPADVDLAVFECGLFERGPDGERLLSDREREILADELTHEAILDRVDRVDPARALLTEIGHQYARSYDDYRALEQTAAYEGIQFAYDGLTVEV